MAVKNELFCPKCELYQLHWLIKKHWPKNMSWKRKVFAVATGGLSEKHNFTYEWKCANCGNVKLTSE